jgi:hypothetical protein
MASDAYAKILTFYISEAFFYLHGEKGTWGKGDWEKGTDLFDFLLR